MFKRIALLRDEPMLVLYSGRIAIWKCWFCRSEESGVLEKKNNKKQQDEN